MPQEEKDKMEQELCPWGASGMRRSRQQRAEVPEGDGNMAAKVGSVQEDRFLQGVQMLEAGTTAFL